MSKAKPRGVSALMHNRLSVGNRMQNMPSSLVQAQAALGLDRSDMALSGMPESHATVMTSSNGHSYGKIPAPLLTAICVTRNHISPVTMYALKSSPPHCIYISPTDLNSRAISSCPNGVPTGAGRWSGNHICRRCSEIRLLYKRKRMARFSCWMWSAAAILR